MKISENGDVTDFCCAEFDKATLFPNKSISIQPIWKDHFIDKPHPRACLMVSKSGRSINVKTGMVDDSGFDLVPISECPFCKKELKFEIGAPDFKDDMTELRELKKQGKIEWIV